MQRLVLALIAVAILVALLAVALTAVRRLLAPDSTLPATTTATGTQKIAFALLGGLMLYVAFAGSA